MSRRRHVTSGSPSASQSIEDAAARASRPSKNKCTTGVSGPETAEELSPGEWWKRKNAIVDQFIEEMPARAARPISVRGGTKLREECTREKISREEFYRSRSWSEVLNEFLKWYNGYRDAYLVFVDPDGEEVRGEMPNSQYSAVSGPTPKSLKAAI